MSEGIYRTVDDFIRRVHNGELIIEPQAGTITFSIMDNRGSEREKSLAAYLGQGMASYEVNRTNPSQKKQSAEECLACINLAYSHGVIQERRNVVQRLRECEQANKQLLKDNAILSARLQELEALRKRVLPLSNRKNNENDSDSRNGV